MKGDSVTYVITKEAAREFLEFWGEDIVEISAECKEWLLNGH